MAGGVDGFALAVDRDVVMPPAHRAKVVGVVGTASGPGDDVMNLDAVTAVTAIDHTAAVTGQDEAAHLECNYPGGRPNRQRDTGTRIDQYLD